MDTHLIFISSSQRGGHAEIPRAVHDLVASTTGSSPFFAPEHHGPEGTTEGIFEKIRECSGFIAFLHARGMVQGDRDAPFYRSSVWVNQELALISYRHADGDPVPVLAFQEEPADCQLLWEGVLASTLYSPKPLIDVDTVIARVKKWLATEQFFPGSADAFSTAWARISSKFIPVLQAIRELASVDVDRELLRRRVEQNGIKEGARMLVLQAVGELLSWGMITTPDPTSAFSPVSIRREWRAHINRKLSELRKQGAS